MKAKKLMGMIACASACVSLSAFGNETNGWFGVTVTGETVNPVNIATNGVGVAQEGRLVLEDVEKDNPLRFTPDVNAPTNRNDGIFVIQASAALTPNSTNDLEGVDGAKAGFAVGIDDTNATNYYGYANNIWHKLTGVDVVAEGQDTTFRLILNYRDSKVDFYAGAGAGTHLGQFDMATGTTAPGAIDAYGTGSITSITGEYEVAVAAYDGKKYGSGAEAVIAKGNGGGAIQDVDPSTGAVAEQKLADNGLYAWECDVLGIEDDAQIALTNNGIIEDGGTTYIKLANAVEVPEGVSVTFNVKNGSGNVVKESCAADAIKIPLTTGTYTIEPTITATSNE